jgi:hypothetical protein
LPKRMFKNFLALLTLTSLVACAPTALLIVDDATGTPLSSAWIANQDLDHHFVLHGSDTTCGGLAASQSDASGRVSPSSPRSVTGSDRILAYKLGYHVKASGLEGDPVRLQKFVGTNIDRLKELSRASARLLCWKGNATAATEMSNSIAAEATSIEDSFQADLTGEHFAGRICLNLCSTAGHDASATGERHACTDWLESNSQACFAEVTRPSRFPVKVCARSSSAPEVCTDEWQITQCDKYGQNCKRSHARRVLPG